MRTIQKWSLVLFGTQTVTVWQGVSRGIQVLLILVMGAVFIWALLDLITIGIERATAHLAGIG